MNENIIGLTIIADRYAIALIELGEKINRLDIFNDDLFRVKATFEANKELVKFLEHPIIPLKDKKDVIDSIFKNFISQYIINLLKLLLDINRIFIFSFIVEHYHKILNQKRNIVVAQVITAIKIEDDIKNKVKNQLEELFNMKIELEPKIDSDIIAGMIIKVGDRIIDGSIKTKLENMKKQLI
ncbi:MAG: ATP synthase F1 subunit delta [bacterium]